MPWKTPTNHNTMTLQDAPINPPCATYIQMTPRLALLFPVPGLGPDGHGKMSLQTAAGSEAAHFL